MPPVRTLIALLTLAGLLACLPHQQLNSTDQPVSRTPRILFVAPDGDDSGRGTRSNPLRSISAAAGLAGAGDVVRILPGSYDEAVEVTGEGRPDRPIVFEAETPGTVIISGDDAGFAPSLWAGDDDTHLQSGNRWVTLAGLVFRRIGDRPAVRASTGWRIENSTFQEVSFGVNVRGDAVTVTTSVFQDIDSPDAHAIVVFGGGNHQLTDLVIRRVNQKRLIESIAHSAVLKILAVDGLLIERVVSQNNVGPGLWLDSNNKNFVIRYSYISGNRGDRHFWEGPGIWIENNVPSYGEIYGNVITDNSGMGIEIMESSFVSVHDNILLGNDTCIGLRNLDRGGGRGPLSDLQISRNLCGDWKSAGIATGVGDWTNWNAESRRVVIDEGRYMMPPETPVFSWLGEDVMTLQEAAGFGLEPNGAVWSASPPPSEDRR